MWRTSPVRGLSASTRTPTSIDVRHAALTVDLKLISSPTWMGAGTSSGPWPRSRRAGCEWRIAAIPAASSHSFITTPPWTKPAMFASVGPIQWTSTELEWEAGRGSTDR